MGVSRLDNTDNVVIINVEQVLYSVSDTPLLSRRLVKTSHEPG